jgi:hypothetical protein
LGEAVVQQLVMKLMAKLHEAVHGVAESDPTLHALLMREEQVTF